MYLAASASSSVPDTLPCSPGRARWLTYSCNLISVCTSQDPLPHEIIKRHVSQTIMCRCRFIKRIVSALFPFYIDQFSLVIYEAMATRCELPGFRHFLYFQWRIQLIDRKSTHLNYSHVAISYAVIS